MAITPAALKAAIVGDLGNALVASIPGGIEAQEAAGQRTLVASTDMPKQMSPSQEAFEAIGFKFGKPIDEVFLSATLPPGWTRKATDHSMHSDIFDDKGRRRVGVFYKAAFYDRRAHAYLVPRYSISRDYDLPDNRISVVIQDAGKEIYRTIEMDRTDYSDDDRHEAVAKKWLLELKPDAFEQSAWDS